MTNEIYAKLCGIENSGNSITEFPQKEPQIRMRNMYVKKGELSFADALSEIEAGILIEKVGMGEVNMYTGDFFLMVSRAYKITSGKISTPVLIGPLHFDAMKFNKYQIKLCNDSLDNMSLCGKNGSIVNVHYNCPSIVLRE